MQFPSSLAEDNTVILKCVFTNCFSQNGMFSSRNGFVYYLMLVNISYHIVSSEKNFHQGNQQCVCTCFQKLKSSRSNSEIYMFINKYEKNLGRNNYFLIKSTREGHS